MTMELNIFNIAKQPHNADDGIVDVDLIEALVDNTFVSNLEKMVGQLASSVQTLAMTVKKGKF